MNEPELVVRPINYVEDEPIVRRIGDRRLFLGNRHAADPSKTNRSFDAVLTVSTDAYPLTTHHRPLTDGPDNEWAAFESAVDTARELYRQDGSLLIHCKAGISRSSTITAAAIATEEGRPFRDTLALVQQARPSATPHPSLHESAVVYLAARE